MNRIRYIALCMYCAASCLYAQNNYFFPGKSLDPAIPSPQQFLGYNIGEQHTRHDRLVSYMEKLASLSPKITLQTIGYTYEHRPQIIVTITDPVNYAKQEAIRQSHLDLCDPKKPNPDYAQQSLIVWLGYNVHGNEPSSSEAAMLTAYYLVASNDAETSRLLKESIVLMEPVINPDGRDRHTHWANMHKGTPPVADPLDREHNEVWPGGRTNHYWFDLNRDWFLAVHVESRNRLAFYHEWLPNVVTDFHEMGTNATHFFEPSKENAENPLVPPSLYRNLNEKFAGYFVKAMNKIGSLYYTKESFDNFYPGYGSSYPDLEGGLGLLFEQASSRGHVQESQHGDLSFAFTIRNQLTNSLATLEASLAEKETLLKHQREFFSSALNEAQKDPVKAYVIGDNRDMSRNKAFWALLLRHKIQAYHLNQDLNINGKKYEMGKAVLVPLSQPQYRMIRSIFDRPQSFRDSLFYDASTWNLALAYGLPHEALKTAPTIGKILKVSDLIPDISSFAQSEYAYLLDWTDYRAPEALYKLLSKNIRVKVAQKPFTIEGREFGYGTLLIPVSLQAMESGDLYAALREIQAETGVYVQPLSTGYSQKGVDLGSNTLRTVDMPKALMLLGGGVSGYEAGEIWHLLDTRVGMPISKVDISNISRIDWGQYNTLILAGGNYSSLDKTSAARIKRFVSEGGTLIAFKGALPWLIREQIVKEKIRKPALASGDTTRNKVSIPFDEAAANEGARNTGGAIFMADMDLSHPLAYGFTEKNLPVYKNDNTLLEHSLSPYDTPLAFGDKPYICGYVHKDNLRKIAGSAAIVVSYEGAGRAALFTFNPNFRGSWYGTNKLFLNALFFGGMINTPRNAGGEEE